MTNEVKPRPNTADPVTAGYWAAARASRLVVSRCSHCLNQLWPPERSCPVCFHTEFEWDDVEPRGTLWSYAIYHRALDPAFAGDVPYAVGLVELESGFKMYGIIQSDLESLAVGMPAVAVFDRVDDDVTFVRWRVE